MLPGWNLPLKGSLACDTVQYPRADGLFPVRFVGTYDIAITLRVYNRAGNTRTTTPYRAYVSAAARDWVQTFDTGELPATGYELQYTDYVTHTWTNNTLHPTDSLVLSLDHVHRGTTNSFWPHIFVQFLHVRLTVNVSDEAGALSGNYESWEYGERASPSPPPPPRR